MSEQILTIETTVKIDNKGVTGSPYLREIKAEDAHANTITVPKFGEAGCKKCVLIGAGPRSLLKFLLLKPVPKIPKDDEPPKAGVPAAAKETPTDILKKGFTFCASDDWGTTGDIPLTEIAIYTDSQLDLLFGEGQRTIEKITFENPTDYCIDVTIVQGKDLSPCNEDAACAMPAPAAKR